MGYSHLRERRGVLYLPGVSGNYASVPDTGDLDITGDIDIRAKVALDDWTPSSSQIFASKSADPSQISWRFQKTASALQFRWSTDGTGTGFSSESSTTDVTATNGEPLWVRVTVDVDNGASAYEIKFYTSDNGTDWTQLGTTKTGGSTTSLHSGTAPVEIGSRDSGANDLLTGKVHEVQIYDGIAGTLVYNPIFDHPATPWIMDGFQRRDSTGRVTTINGTRWEWRAA